MEEIIEKKLAEMDSRMDTLEEKLDRLINMVEIMSTENQSVGGYSRTESLKDVAIDVKFESYKNCYKILGDTKSIKSTIKENNGKWNPSFKCWIVGKSSLEKMKNAIW